MKFNDQKQFIVDRFTKELENAGLGAYRIEVVRDTNYCFRLASTCYINRRGYVRGYNEQPVMYFKVYEKVTDKCRHADMYKYMCYIFNSGTFVEYLKDKHRNHWSREDFKKIQSIQYKHGFRQTTLN